MNTCCVCQAPIDKARRGRQMYCETCNTFKFEVQATCIQRVAEAVKIGVLPKIKEGTKCADCGKQAREYDHRDYSKPLVVEPVCRSCNVKRGPALFPRAA